MDYRSISLYFRNIDKKTKKLKMEGDLVKLYMANTENKKENDQKHFKGRNLSNRDTFLMNFFEKHRNEANFYKFEDSGAHYVRIPRNIQTNPHQMLFYIKNVLDTFFEMVLIREYFDESLVLMRRKLCWQFQDILYFPLKVGEYNLSREQYSDELMEKHKQLLVSLTFFSVGVTKG